MIKCQAQLKHERINLSPPPGEVGKYKAKLSTLEEDYLYWGLDVKAQLNVKLSNALVNWPQVFKKSNEEIIKDIRRFTNGEFGKVNIKDELLSDHIQEWKALNLKGGN